MRDDGKPNFPNAQIHLSQADYDFWTDLSLPAAKTDAMKPLFEGARKHLVPNRDRIVFVNDGQEFLLGIQAMAAPGHTLGHTAYIIASAGQSLAFLGDTTNHPVALFEDPRIEFAFDMDGKQAVKHAREFSTCSRQAAHHSWDIISHGRESATPPNVAKASAIIRRQCRWFSRPARASRPK